LSVSSQSIWRYFVDCFEGESSGKQTETIKSKIYEKNVMTMKWTSVVQYLTVAWRSNIFIVRDRWYKYI
jgi:hypothetical protein